MSELTVAVEAASASAGGRFAANSPASADCVRLIAPTMKSAGTAPPCPHVRWLWESPIVRR